MATFDDILKDKESREAYRIKVEFDEYKWVMQRVKDGYGVPSGFCEPGK
jgi:hypothetical protein